MKKLIVPLILGLSTGFAVADSKITFSVNGTDGTQKVYNISDVNNITFDGDMMVISHSEGTDEHELDAIQDMVFATVSGIDEVFEGELGDGLQVSVNHGVLTALLPGGDLTLRVFTMGGNMIDSMSAREELTYQLAPLDKGVYIILVNDKAIKFIR